MESPMCECNSESAGMYAFFDVFPLNDPSANASEDESLKQRQFDFITALLKDEDHRVKLFPPLVSAISFVNFGSSVLPL